MQFRKTQKGYIIRLLKGEELVTQITAFCERENVHAGIFHAIGSASQATVGFFSPEQKEFHFTSLEQPLEIVSLTGNIALVEGKPLLHIHTVVSDTELRCIGGHLKEAVIGPTCEVYLMDFETEITREHDAEIGLNLLQCDVKSV